MTVLRASSDALLRSRRREAEVAKIGRTPRTSSADLEVSSAGLGLHFSPVAAFHTSVSPLAQLAVVCLASVSLLRSRIVVPFKSRRSRWLLVAALWLLVEAARVGSFRRLKRALKSAALRTPVARKGIKPMERVSSDCPLPVPEDDGGQTVAQAALCRHLQETLSKGHLFTQELLCHFRRKGWRTDYQGWLTVLHGVLSNSGTVSVRAQALVELRKAAAACSNDPKPDWAAKPGPIPWGVAAIDNAFPRPLLADALIDVMRKLMSVDLRRRGYSPRRVYIKVTNAEIEYLLWIHPGPKDAPRVPIIFLHGVGAGAALYGPVLGHLAQQRRVIAVEVPGVSLGQVCEAGPAAVLDGLASAVQIALGGQVPYDIVGHSGGGWWTSVLLRAVRRGQLHAPRRVLVMQSPVVAPGFLRILLLGAGDIRDTLPCPYIPTTGWSSRVVNWTAGYVIHALFAKELWNLHCMYLGFTADELVILPETVVPYPETEVLFLFGERDCFMSHKDCVAYLEDSLVAPHIRSAVLAGCGHGTFMLFSDEWKATMSVADEFLKHGHR
eukprot:TRINITY_DN18465_c0_g1_i1.p1 TRINITY_DN18465_c0_g1~~TRINITY_DN18465_c0_g1_i1.p1  ORF type:complete len:579 (+),score=84.53 TRINITY_DN18465_c0_g1_i1:81-1739(+)